VEAELYWISGPWSGKLAMAPHPRGDDWLSGEIASWRYAGINAVLSLLTPEEEQDLDLTREREEVERQGLRFLSLPIPDREIPSSTAALAAVTSALERDLHGGQNVVIHCRQGVGRSGLVAACLLIASGGRLERALLTLRNTRGLPVPETEEQMCWLERYSVDHGASRTVTDADPAQGHTMRSTPAANGL
jgi:protein-tyrosine phosphatase